MIDWTKPIEIIHEDGSVEPASWEWTFDERTVDGYYINEDGEGPSLLWRVRNVPMPEPTATWWARRWYDSASPDEREAMRVILAGEG